MAIGIAIDTLYSEEMGYLDSESSERILRLLKSLKFELYTDHLEKRNGSRFPYVLEGLEEFREHLGGLLTITLLKRIGSRFEVHEMDTEVVLKAIDRLKELNQRYAANGGTEYRRTDLVAHRRTYAAYQPVCSAISPWQRSSRLFLQ